MKGSNLYFFFVCPLVFPRSLESPIHIRSVLRGAYGLFRTVHVRAAPKCPIFPRLALLKCNPLCKRLVQSVASIICETPYNSKMGTNYP